MPLSKKRISIKFSCFYLSFIPLCFLVIAVVIGSTQSASAMSRLGCLGMGAAEYLVPGLGYAITKQYDKAIILGGARWIASNQVLLALESPNYQEDPEDIYTTVEAEDSESGKTETTVTLNKETWNVQFYGNLYGNLLFTTWGDLYQNSCQPNTETYSLMLSPFRFDHFYKKWQFWVPMAILASNYTYFSEFSKVEYRLGTGLTKDDLMRETFPQYYMVGVGEEMLFRGTIQHFFFESFKNTWDLSPSLSRYLSIFGASTVFAAAHSGTGFTADFATAFAFGVYEGFVYHTSLEEFDLMTAIAIHAWWDIIVSYTILTHSDFSKNQNAEIPILKIAFRF